MVLPVAFLLLAGLVLYSGLHDQSLTDTLRGALGRAPTGKLGSLSGYNAGSGTGGNSNGASDVTGDGTAASAASIAQASLSIRPGGAGYSQHRPIPANLAACQTTPTDCSGFATLVYKQAGLPDPNGGSYSSGAAYTGTMEEHGKKTDTPQPGDLVFWSSPDHVAIYVGNGNCIGWGAPPGPIQDTIAQESTYHASYLGARTYV